MRSCIPTIPEKTHIPRLPTGYVARPRLDRAWPAWQAKRLVLVTAGAGFGKTSFLAANAREGGRRCSWLSLDEADVDLAVLGAHLRVALGGRRAQEEEQSDPADPGFARRLLAEVAGALRANGGRVLVLDDAHLVRDSSPVLRFLEDVVRYLPAGNTLILSSREPLAVATLKARCQGGVSEVVARDLEFRADEAVDLFAHRFQGARLDMRQARRLVAQTEGWASGIEIFLQLLDGSNPDAVARALDRMGAAGTGWFGYFAEEVVGKLDAPTQNFLVRTSVLSGLQPEICDELLDISDSRSRLEELTRRNLFTVATGGSVHGYRYHHLFRAFLRDRLRRRLSAAAYQSHLRRAARLLARQGAWAEAAEAHAEAGDADATLRLIERAGEGMLTAGRYEAVQRAFACLPAKSLRERPAVAFLHARLCDYQHRWADAERHYRRVLRSDPHPGRRVESMSLIAQILSRRGRYRAAMGWCRKAEAQGLRAGPRVRGRIQATIGVCAAELGRLSEGERTLLRARRLHQRSQDLAGEARIEYLLAVNIYLRRGELTRARDAARGALLRFRRLNNPRRVCYSLGVLAYISSERGDMREARELAEETLRVAESLGLAQQEGFAQLVLGRCARAAGDLDAAVRHLGLALEVGERLGERDLRAFPRLDLAGVHAARGNPHAARAMAREALEIMRATHDPMQEARCALLLGSLHVEEDRAEARRWWRRAERLLRASGARFDLGRLLLLRIDAGEIAPRRLPSALAELLDPGRQPDPEVLFRISAPVRAARVLAQAIRCGVGGEAATRYLADLGEAAVTQLEPLTRDPIEAVRLRAVEVLARIGGAQARAVLGRLAQSAARDATPLSSAARAAEEIARAPERPLRIEALGALSLRVGRESCSPKAWRSARALRLLQLLLVHRFHWVDKEVVIEALWPEADPEKASGNLWQSVHRLRRALEPELRELRDSRYVRFQNDAYRLEPGDNHFYDVLAFEQGLREGQALVRAERPRAAETRLRRALELYRGDFLAESPYEEFAAVEREGLREQFLRGTALLLDLYARTRRWADCLPLARRGLSEDSFNEACHQALVHTNLMLGHRREALAHYHAYEETMLRELGLLPSARMKALAEEITCLGGGRR